MTSADADEPVAAGLVASLRSRGQTVVTAESLTAGLVSATIADVPGASDVLRGGIVAYAVPVKVALLGVPQQLMAIEGVVSESVAAAMAEGARGRLGADWGLATTGVAGPGPSDGVAAGTVCLGVAGPAGTATQTVHLAGDRPQVRRMSVDTLICWAARLVSGYGGDGCATAPSRGHDRGEEVQDGPAASGAR